MGTILNSKRKDDGKVIVEVLVDYEEAVQLQGSMENIHIFSDEIADIKMEVSHRGKNESTKYFLIPKEFRKNIKFNTKVNCQLVDTKTKLYFIYSTDKMGI